MPYMPSAINVCYRFLYGSGTFYRFPIRVPLLLQYQLQVLTAVFLPCRLILEGTYPYPKHNKLTAVYFQYSHFFLSERLHKTRACSLSVGSRPHGTGPSTMDGGGTREVVILANSKHVFEMRVRQINARLNGAVLSKSTVPWCRWAAANRTTYTHREAGIERLWLCEGDGQRNKKK